MTSLAVFDDFKTKFIENRLSIPESDRPSPFRLVEDKVKLSELVGHCAEWAAQYLYTQ